MTIIKGDKTTALSISDVPKDIIDKSIRLPALSWSARAKQ